MPSVRKLSIYPSSMTSVEWADIAPAVRNTAFFSATVEDERVLAALLNLVTKGAKDGSNTASLVDEALQMLENISLDPDARAGESFRDSFETLYDVNRLKLIFRTQNELSHGYSQMCDEFSNISLQLNPGWRFVRQPGAKEEQKRLDHVRHEGAVRLKTDTQFWKDRNRHEIGGFGNPFGPWGYNSWMRTEPVGREECERLGLLKPNEKLAVPAEYAQYGLADTIKGLGAAGVADLNAEQQKRIVDRCAEEGFTVQRGEDALQVLPGAALSKLEEKALDEWAEREMRRLMQMSEDDILRELMGEE